MIHRTEEGVLRDARRYNEKGIIGFNGDPVEEKAAFEGLIRQHKKLLKSVEGEVSVAEEKRLRNEMRELQQAYRGMEQEEIEAGLRLSAQLKERDVRVPETGGLDAEISEIFSEAAGLRGSTSGQATNVVTKQYEGGFVSGRSKKSISTLD